MSDEDDFERLLDFGARGYSDVMHAILDELVARGVDPVARLVALATSHDGNRVRAARCLILHGYEQALALELHRDPTLQEDLVDAARHLEPAEQSRFVARMLEADDPNIVRRVLPSKALGVLELLRDQHPELLPLDLVRARVADAERDIRAAAVDLLCCCHLPEDAERVIAALDDESTQALQRAGRSPIAWLGALPSASRLAPWLRPEHAARLLAHRRCAGLSNAEVDTRAARASSRGLGRVPAAFVFELRDEAYFRAWFERQPLDRSDPDDTTLEATVSYGQVGLEVARGRLAGATHSPHTLEVTARFCAKLEARFAQSPTPPFAHAFPRNALATADREFAIEALDSEQWLVGATHQYARVLFYDPRNAHAAVQLAWIDRGFGTPITSERLAWLRSLGVHDDELLDELARPIAPWRYERGRRGQCYPLHAPRLEDWRQREAAIAAHLERVRRATA